MVSIKYGFGLVFLGAYVAYDIFFHEDNDYSVILGMRVHVTKKIVPGSTGMVEIPVKHKRVNIKAVASEEVPVGVLVEIISEHDNYVKVKTLAS
jgi:hypothetical protein